MILPDCIDGTIYNGVACERAIKTERDISAPRCKCGGKLYYRPSVGGYSCYNGSLYASGGTRMVRDCGR
jgi:hypothetical protein